ncbi:MAG TPA: TetR/AcrR family transcriptional regulator [Candidatus Corynebacterium avicola]|uniref:TetR/AcrR family transcriptional regulator n=1 Tax=Candidatus Corynebacterium avicola TaxID=2838527 RepID=A0A9D1UKG7_9CORY|nr:TetR/AcrR family transcriptional regulator [Candidatus Corynebacterium avicola]
MGVGKKTGPKPSFTREDVVDAAVSIGLDTFTLAQVAKQIGVVTSAVYRRFDSRDDLLDACLARAASTIAVPEPGTDWQEICRLWANECWRVCEDFPGLAHAVYSHATAFTHVGQVATAYSEALEAHGRSRGQAGFALDFLGDTVFACRLGVESMREVDESGQSGLSRAQEQVEEQVPGHPMQPDESWTGRGMTDVKVDFIIDGLERHWPEL